MRAGVLPSETSSEHNEQARYTTALQRSLSHLIDRPVDLIPVLVRLIMHAFQGFSLHCRMTVRSVTKEARVCWRPVDAFRTILSALDNWAMAVLAQWFATFCDGGNSPF